MADGFNCPQAGLRGLGVSAVSDRVQRRPYDLRTILLPLSILPVCLATLGVDFLVSPSHAAGAKALMVVPAVAEVGVGGTQPFRACRRGRLLRRSPWAVNDIPGGNGEVGTISVAGLFTAPPRAPRPPRLVITARDPSNPGAAVIATLIVRDVVNYAHTNPAGDLSGTNVGDAISLGWAAPPEATTQYVAFRAATQEGPWREAARFERVIDQATQVELTVTPLYTPGVDPSTDAFYRLEARAAGETELRRYAPVFVPRYVDERLGRPEVTPGPRQPRCPPAGGSGAYGKGVR